MRFGALLVLCGVVVADDTKDAERFTMHLTREIRGGWSPSYFWPDDVVRDALSKSPHHSLEVCRVAAGLVREQNVGANQPGQLLWRQLSEFLKRVTDAGLLNKPKDPDALRAAAEAALLQARLIDEQGKPADTASWRRAVDLLIREHALRPSKGEPLLVAAVLLLNEHRDDGYLLKVCAIGAPLYPTKYIFYVPAGRDALDAAKEPKALKALLDRWRPFAASYDDFMLGLYNEAITVAARRGVKTKHRYLTRMIARASQQMMFDVPYGRWVWDNNENLRQYSREGELVRSIRIVRSFPGLSKRDREAEVAVYRRELNGKTTSKLRKRKFNRHYKKAYEFAVSGFSKEGDPVHGRCFFVRGGSGTVTIDVRQSSPRPDPEVEFILSTMRPLSFRTPR